MLPICAHKVETEFIYMDYQFKYCLVKLFNQLGHRGQSVVEYLFFRRAIIQSFHGHLSEVRRAHHFSELVYYLLQLITLVVYLSVYARKLLEGLQV